VSRRQRVERLAEGFDVSLVRGCHYSAPQLADSECATVGHRWHREIQSVWFLFSCASVSLWRFPFSTWATLREIQCRRSVVVEDGVDVGVSHCSRVESGLAPSFCTVRRWCRRSRGRLLLRLPKPLRRGPGAAWRSLVGVAGEMADRGLTLVGDGLEADDRRVALFRSESSWWVEHSHESRATPPMTAVACSDQAAGSVSSAQLSIAGHPMGALAICDGWPSTAAHDE